MLCYVMLSLVTLNYIIVSELRIVTTAKKNESYSNPCGVYCNPSGCRRKPSVKRRLPHSVSCALLRRALSAPAHESNETFWPLPEQSGVLFVQGLRYRRIHRRVWLEILPHQDFPPPRWDVERVEQLNRIISFVWILRRIHQRSDDASGGLYHEQR